MRREMTQDFVEKMEKTTEYLNPVRIVQDDGCEGTEWLLTSKYEQVMLSGQACATVKPGGRLVLDFGVEIAGGIRLLNAGSPSKLHLVFGESLSEAMSDLGEENTTNDHALRDVTTDLPFLSDQTFGQTGFRFVRIDNVGQKEVRFVAVYGAYTHLKQLPVGAFECSDETVNRIYQTAVRTLFLCMQNRLWDGIKRDRLVWIGDMHPETMGIFCLYGAHPLIELGLAETAESTPPDRWMDDIPSYSFWWLAILCDYAFYGNRYDFASDWLDYADKMVDKIDTCVDENGEINYGGDNNMFLNWETYGEASLPCGNRGLLLWTMNKYVSLLEHFGKKNEKVNGLIERLKKNDTFDATSKAVTSLYALGYGYTDAVKKVLCDGKTDGFSTFMSDYIASAIYDCGQKETALELMKSFYTGMLERGATTFWESYDPSWLDGSNAIDTLPKEGEKNIHTAFGKYCYQGHRLSLCHGWSCGPIHFLTKKALGVEFLEPGGKKVAIHPDLMGLAWAKGVVPTAYGNIVVEHKKVCKTVKTTVTLPDGVEWVK